MTIEDIKNIYELEKIEKIGNSIRCLSSKESLTLEMLFKQLFLLEYTSIKYTGVPFFNLLFEYDIVNDKILIPSFVIQNKIDVYFSIDNNNRISSIGEFNDDEFSNKEIKLMDRLDLTTFNECLNKCKLTSGQIKFDHLIEHDLIKDIYKEYLDFHGNPY